MSKKLKIFFSAVAAALLVFTASCNLIYEDMPQCPQPPRFYFHVKMSSNYTVDKDLNWCGYLYIFDMDGKSMQTHSESGNPFRDDSYHLTVGLEDGKYLIAALIGLEGNEFFRKSFATVQEFESALSQVPYSDKNPMWYGKTEITAEKHTCNQHTIELIR